MFSTTYLALQLTSTIIGLGSAGYISSVVMKSYELGVNSKSC
jgi:hypothetical protein